MNGTTRWCSRPLLGGAHWVAVAAGSAAAPPATQHLAARTALLCGIASGESRHAWGRAPATAAPALLSLLSMAHVPEQVVDSVSGCVFLMARLISSAAEGSDGGRAAGNGFDTRW